MNAEIAEYNEARERELPLVQEADAKVKELRQTIQDLNKHQVSQRTSIKKLKEKIEEQEKKVRILMASSLYFLHWLYPINESMKGGAWLSLEK